MPAEALGTERLIVAWQSIRRAIVPSLMTPLQRTFVAAALFSTWIVCLLSGWAFGGAVHLALAGALAVFPWRDLRSRH